MPLQTIALDALEWLPAWADEWSNIPRNFLDTHPETHGLLGRYFGRVIDAAKLQKIVKDQGFLIDGGYGKIKGTTFRISNMGDETEATMQQLYAALDLAMKTL